MKLPLRIVFTMLGCIGTGSCISTSNPGSTSLPEQVRRDPAAFLVVTVLNDARMQTIRPGSTARGYDSAGLYGVTGKAGGTVHQLERDYGLHQVSAWPITTLRVHCIVFRIPAAAARAGIIDRLSRDPRVESVQPLNEFATQSQSLAEHQDAGASLDRSRSRPYNDPYAPLQHALGELGVIQAQQRSRGAGVTIAIIDTGVDFDHPDLEGHVTMRRNFVDADEQAFKHDRHGTQMAGVIAASANNGIGIVGIAPEVRLVAIKACWQVGASADHAVCNSFTLAQALEAAIAARVNLVNLSLAGPPDPLLTRLLQRGMQEGIGFVGAVVPRDVSASFPSAVEGVFAVEAAEDDIGDPPHSSAQHLLAPGHDIVTLVPDSHYDFASGSSLATAEVSGALALLLAQNPRLSLTSAHRILLRSSQQVQTPGGMLTSINVRSALEDREALGSCGPGKGCLREATR